MAVRMTARPTVSVVIPARNAAAYLEAQLAALVAQDFAAPYEVLVADNGSTDATASIARRWAARHAFVRLVDARARAGIGYARNTGVRAAAGDVVLFCDCDDEAAPGWIAGMVEALGRADVVGGPLDLTRLNPPAVRAWRGDPELRRLPVTMRFLPYATGANLGVRTSVYRDLGGFDEAYTGSHDDVEFCWRAQLASHSLAYAPDAVMHYRLRGDVRALAKQRSGYGRSYAQLYAQYRHLGIPPGSLAGEARTWARLALRVPHLATAAGRGRWMFDAAWNYGRLAGTLKHHTLCPL
ncbi:glycosyltransferase [Streptomyces sp. NPDC002120]|uniref:glycosyltransferase n=1 Tax=Streptomyces sp. NPDC002120 TaxID=3364631 RepID=UPI0036AD3621